MNEASAAPSRQPHHANPLGFRLFGLGCGAMVLALLVGSALVLAIAGAVLWSGGRWLFGPDRGLIISNGPTVTQLERMGDLTVMKVHVADIIEGRADGYRGVWVVKGDALIAVNMRAAHIIDRDDEALRAVIELPAPRVIQPRVDHEKTAEYQVRRTSWVPFWGDEGKLRTEAMQQAQRLVGHAAQDEDAIEQARRNAVSLVANLYRMLGWDVDIVWSDGGDAPTPTALSDKGDAINAGTTPADP